MVRLTLRARASQDALPPQGPHAPQRPVLDVSLLLCQVRVSVVRFCVVGTAKGRMEGREVGGAGMGTGMFESRGTLLARQIGLVPGYK